MIFDSVFKMEADGCLSFCYRIYGKRGVLFGNITLIFCFENCMFAWYVLEKYVFLLVKSG